MKKVSTETKILIGAPSALAFIGVLIFLFTDNSFGHTGAEVIFAQGAGYILSSLLFLAVGVGAFYLGLRSYNKSQEVSRLIAGIVGLVICLALAFGKMATDKANDGVTGPKGRPTSSL